MPCDYSHFPHSGIQSLNPYIPGKTAEELAEEQGLTNIIKLASNENQLGCSQQATEALNKLTGHQLAKYVIAQQHPMRKQLAIKLGINVEMLTLANGSETLIPLLQTCFALHTNKHILIPTCSFIAYSIHAKILRIPVISTPLLPNWQANIDALIAHCNKKTALIFLANPNNPTGALISQIEIERLLENIPSSTILVLDEAYYEFVNAVDKLNTLSLLNKYSNLVVTRTFSKAHGLAGLRLGYAMSNTQISSIIQRVLSSFTVNVAALVAGSAALEDDDFLRKSVKNNTEGLQQIQQGLTKLGISHLPSAGNFITFDCKADSNHLFQKLLQRGIILRPLHPYGMDNYLRVTIGTKEQNIRFLNNLEEVLHEK